MAAHNQVRIVGYLLKDPVIINKDKPGEEKILMQVRTTRRDIEGYYDDLFADLVVFYDGTELMEKLKGLRKFDVIDTKGVFNILPTQKKHKCTYCGHENIKYNSLSTFVYPIALQRIASYKDFYAEQGIMPNRILEDNYKEISNQCIILGTVVSEPELIETKNHVQICRYCLGVDRKYYIKTQDEQSADYPWVYSYGRQALRDYEHLVDKESLILVDGFLHNRKIRGSMHCDHCGSDFTFQDVGAQFTPYAVEYLTGFKRDEDIERENETMRRRQLHEES